MGLYGFLAMEQSLPMCKDVRYHSTTAIILSSAVELSIILKKKRKHQKKNKDSRFQMLIETLVMLRSTVELTSGRDWDDLNSLQTFLVEIFFLK